MPDLIEFWRQARVDHHIGPQFVLTEEGKRQAPTCGCGPCTWTEPAPPKAKPERKPRRQGMTAKEWRKHKRAIVRERALRLEEAALARLEADRRMREEAAAKRAEREARGEAARLRERARQQPRDPMTGRFVKRKQ
jgi:hypothetical protein